MLLSDRRPIFALLLGALFWFGFAAHAGAADTSNKASSSAEFLYQIAREYRRTGQYEEAVHNLRKVLLVNPTHSGALRELRQIEAVVVTQRQEAMDHALTGMQTQLDQLTTATDAGRATRAETDAEALAKFRSQSEALTRRVVTGTAPGRASTVRAPKLAPLAPVVRAPDASVNGVRWFYVFGTGGEPDYGALGESHVTFIEAPRNADAAVRVRVLDADTREKHDEMTGGWDTSTAFRVFGGSQMLDMQVVGPEAPDGTIVDFGPFTPEQGQIRNDAAVFRLEAEGLDGDDNNLFAYEVSPASSQVFSFQPSIRLAKEAGQEMRFFPAIPSDATRLTEANYDLDADGGRLSLMRMAQTGRSAGSVPLAGSSSEAWALTDVDVPADTAGTRWTYTITKGEQRKANMAFQVTDQRGAAVPIYTTRGGPGGFTQPVQGEGTSGSARGAGETLPRRAYAEVLSRSCNTFTFDASASYDPDNDALAYRWDFGDGTSAEGMRATHTYENAGDFRVVLEVTDTSSQPCGISRSEQIVHVNTPPIAVLEAPTHACAAAGVRFSAARSRDSEGEALSYRWDFGDGATAEGAEVTHAFATGGSYTVQLVVDDGRGTSCSTDRAVVNVRVNSPPTVSVEPSVAMCASPGEPLSVVLSAVNSSDPDLNTLAYRWDFGDGSTGEGAWTSHVYQQGGRYPATVTVDDGTGLACSTASATVGVHVNRAPRVALSPWPVAHGCAREPVTFDASSSSDPDNDALSFVWDFGDNTRAEGSMAQHAYASHGDFPVTLTVDDGSGLACGTVNASVTADVNALPVARFVIHGEDASSSVPPEQLR